MQIKALLFDVFGTVVDWRTGLVHDFAWWGARNGVRLDWAAFVDDWRGMYEESKAKVRDRGVAWIKLDDLHMESLETLLARYNIEGLTAEQKRWLSHGWHRLNGWPDAAEGLARLHARYILGPLSNGNTSLLIDMARHARLPWDVIFSAEVFRTYKPAPQTYLGAVEHLSMHPSEVMLVAAHNYDLKAARALGLATAFIPRPTEYGPRQTKDFEPSEDWDIVARDLIDLAVRLGC